MPSNQQSEQSGEISAHPENDSVFDFLYYDYTRISSFLAQFESGHVTQVVKSESALRGSKDAVKTTVGGSFKIANGALDDTSEISKSSTHQFSKTYDPRWENALAFLDYLEQKGLLIRDISNARIGQIVLISGQLSIFDLTILQKLWTLPSIKKIVSLGGSNHEQAKASPANRQERRKAGNAAKKAHAESISEAEVMLELLGVLPHSVQAAIGTETHTAWCILRDDSVTVSPTDLFMKHGLSIGGDWTMVGVLDAQPDDETETSEGGTIEGAMQLLAGMRLGGAGISVAPNLVAPVRSMLGRPTFAHGITPLLIFRSVSGDNVKSS